MESTPPLQTTTLASVLDTEKVIAPPRARTLLASLAQATTVPNAPVTPDGWADQILIVGSSDGTERAAFRDVGGAPARSGDRSARLVQHIDALRAAALLMLWGRPGADASADRRAAPDGQPRFPRLRKLLVDQWDATRNTCDSPDKFMMFFEATLALDRAAEPKVGREAFKTLSIQALDVRNQAVKVGTLGIPFDAITDTGKFKKAARPAAAAPATPAPVSPASPPQQPAMSVTDAMPVPPPAASNVKVIALAVIAVIVIAVAAFVVLTR